mgnify:CR=1 FL=1
MGAFARLGHPVRPDKVFFPERWHACTRADIFAGVTAGNITVGVTDDNIITTTSGNLNIDATTGVVAVTNNLTVRGGVDNLLDREYQNHLGGYNRVKEVDTAVMSRLPSEGLSAWLEVSYAF